MEMRWLRTRRIDNPEGLVGEEEAPGAQLLFHLHVLWTRGRTVDRRYACRIEAGSSSPGSTNNGCPHTLLISYFRNDDNNVLQDSRSTRNTR